MPGCCCALRTTQGITRLRDIATSLGITERRAHGMVTDSLEASYVVKQGRRRNSYRNQADLPLPGAGTQEPAIGEVLGLLVGNKDDRARSPELDAAAGLGGGPAHGADPSSKLVIEPDSDVWLKRPASTGDSSA